ncbi:hypothetical protein KSP40_PGU016901 [Platanthera guangdongensis]|uniref:Thioredoxin domain-containing protein n=1 Tax=Platanthera guangdongensis TaxID=2320717 RepID=A0ABR2M4T9_9ASPA
MSFLPGISYRRRLEEDISSRFSGFTVEDSRHHFLHSEYLDSLLRHILILNVIAVDRFCNVELSLCHLFISASSAAPPVAVAVPPERNGDDKSAKLILPRTGAARGRDLQAGRVASPVDCVKEFKTEFSRILERAEGTNSLVVVDFYRASCGSCKYIEQGFAKLCKWSGDGMDSVVFLKHNVNDEQIGITEPFVEHTDLENFGDESIANFDGVGIDFGGGFDSDTVWSYPLQSRPCYAVYHASSDKGHLGKWVAHTYYIQ